MDYAVRFEAHEPRTCRIGSDGIIGENNSAEGPWRSIQWTVAFHRHDRVCNHKIDRNRGADVENALLDAVPVENVFRPTISASRDDAEHVLHAESINRNGGSMINANVGVYINWSVEGGVYGVNTVNGMTVDADGIAELVGSFDAAASNGTAANNGTPANNGNAANGGGRPKPNLQSATCDPGVINASYQNPPPDLTTVQSSFGFPGSCISTAPNIQCYLTAPEPGRGTPRCALYCALPYVPFEQGAYPGIWLPKKNAPTFYVQKHACKKD
jgi:hypothetical protein